MDRLQEKEPVPGSVIQEGLEAVVSGQRKRLAKLQDFADVYGRRMAASIAFPNAEAAAGALRMYTKEWFRDQPYSHEVCRLIAQTLVDAIKPYSFLDSTVWTKIARGDK